MVYNKEQKLKFLRKPYNLLAVRPKSPGMITQTPHPNDLPPASKYMSDGHMNLNKVNDVNYDTHPKTKQFATEYVKGNKVNYSDSITSKDQKEESNFFNKYDKTNIKSGFAGSGTNLYMNRTTGDTFKVDKSANGKTFYGTSHFIYYLGKNPDLTKIQ